jgi:hypothetical protein
MEPRYGPHEPRLSSHLPGHETPKTVVGGVRERFVVTRRGRGMCAPGA